MLTKDCQKYNDDELFYYELKLKSTDAWTCLYRCASSFLKKSTKLLSYSSHLEEKDILQEAQIKLYLKMVDERYFDFIDRKYTFCIILRRMYVSLCIDVYRRDKKFFLTTDLSEAEAMKKDMPNLLDDIINKEKLDKVENILNTLLNENQRLAWKLVIKEYKSHSEAAEEMNTSQSRIANLIYSVREIIRKNLR